MLQDRSVLVRQRHIIVFADPLQNQKCRGALARVGHKMRPPRAHRVALAGFKPHLLLWVAQKETDLAFQHVESILDLVVIMPGYFLSRAELQLSDPEPG